MPLCGPWSPPLNPWPLTSTPNVLLSTHCVPSKSSRVKAAAVKVKMHLFPDLFVQGSHYAECDHATKFSSKINQPPSTIFSHGIPREIHPQGRLSFLSDCTGPAPCLFSFQCPLLFSPSRLPSSLSHTLLPPSHFWVIFHPPSLRQL